MGDEPTRPGEIAQTRERGPLGHVCEHSGCGKDAGSGFAKPKRAPTGPVSNTAAKVRIPLAVTLQ